MRKLTAQVAELADLPADVARNLQNVLSSASKPIEAIEECSAERPSQSNEGFKVEAFFVKSKDLCEQLSDLRKSPTSKRDGRRTSMASTDTRASDSDSEDTIRRRPRTSPCSRSGEPLAIANEPWAVTTRARNVFSELVT